MNAGLFPKPLHILFACTAGMKQSVQAVSLYVMLHIRQLKKDASERGQNRELPRGKSYAPNLHPVVLVHDHLHTEFCTRNRWCPQITSLNRVIC